MEDASFKIFSRMVGDFVMLEKKVEMLHRSHTVILCQRYYWVGGISEVIKCFANLKKKIHFQSG